MPNCRPRSVIFLPSPSRPPGECFRIYVPVSQRVGIVAALAKPSVIHDEQFNAQFLPCLCQRDQTSLGDIEVTGLPAVEKHRAGPMLPRAPDNVLPDKMVHVMAHAGKSGIREGHHRLRGLQAFPWLQPIGKALRVDAGHHSGLVKGTDLCRLIVVAAINQVEAVTGARCLGGVRAVEQEEGICPAGGAARRRAADVLPARQPDGGALHLSGPGPVESGDRPAAVRQIQLEAHQPLHLYCRCAAVYQPAAAADAVAVGIDVVMYLQRQAAASILQRDGEMLHSAVLGVGAGQRLIRGLAFGHLGGAKEKVGGPAAVGVYDL